MQAPDAHVVAPMGQCQVGAIRCELHVRWHTGCAQCVLVDGRHRAILQRSVSPILT